MEINGHVIYTEEDFENATSEEMDGWLYKSVVDGGLSICKKCGDGEAGLDIPCKKVENNPYKIQYLKREEPIGEYAKRKIDEEVVVVTNNPFLYEERANVISYNDYIEVIKSGDVERMKFFIDDLTVLASLLGMKEVVVHDRFILR